MKVLYFHQHFSTPDGTGGLRSYLMARRLIERGHSVTMVCGSYAGGVTGLLTSFANGQRRGVVDGIDVVEFDLAYSNAQGLIRRTVIFLQFAARSVTLALTESYDIVFATTTPLTAGLPGVFARWLRRKPFVFEVRDLWPELPKAMGVIRNRFVLAMLSSLEWVSYRSARRLVALAPGIADGIIERGVAREKITIIPNSCDPDALTHSAVAWRPPMIGAEKFIAVFAGTHGLANGLDAALDAAGELTKRGREDICFVLIGQGMLKSRLQARAEREGLTNVIFLPPASRAQLAGLLLESDIGLQLLANVPAFYYGTSPNKFFDYIASGLPVLNNYPGWLADIIAESDCGFAIPPDDAIAFADCLEVAANNRASLRMKGMRALALARAHFNQANLADRFVDWIIGAISC